MDSIGFGGDGGSKKLKRHRTSLVDVPYLKDYYAFFLSKIHFLILISLHCQGMCKLGMAIFPSSGLVPPPVNVCQNRNDSIRSCDYLCHFSFLHRWPSILFAWANPELTVYDLFKLGHSYKLAWFFFISGLFPTEKIRHLSNC